MLFDEARALLQRGRCVVAFSGGRDSSAVLATLLHVARQDGFDDPVAVTARWPGDAAADESAWQEHVARELRVRRWEIITPGTDFDLLGPLARRAASRPRTVLAGAYSGPYADDRSGRGRCPRDRAGRRRGVRDLGLAGAWARARKGRNLRSSLRRARRRGLAAAGPAGGAPSRGRSLTSAG